MARYYVEARIGASLGIEITAKNLEEAIEKAKALEPKNFFEPHGDINDINWELSGLHKADGAPKV